MHPWFRLISRFCRRANGNVAWIYALALVPLVVVTGGGIDVACVIDVKTRLQDAIDSAVLAGAGAGNSSAVAAEVYGAEQLSKYGIAGAPSYTTNNDGSFTGRVSASVPAKFLPLIGISAIPISVTATARQTGTPTVCILVLNRTASQALLMNSGGDIEAPQCEVHVASTASPAAIFNAQTTLTSSKLCLAGSSIIDNGGSHPNLTKGCTTAADPFAGGLPAPDTTAANCGGGNISGGTTMSPGVYCGWYNFNGGQITFQPGVYVIKGGGWNVNGGTWTGTGVTFYFADSSKIQFNSSVKATLTAPTSGTYSGILMFEASGLGSSQFVLDDSKGHFLQGLIYLPSRQMTVNSGADLTTDQVTVVVDTLIMNNATWNVTPPATKTIAGASTGTAYLMK